MSLPEHLERLKSEFSCACCSSYKTKHQYCLVFQERTSPDDIEKCVEWCWNGDEEWLKKLSPQAAVIEAVNETESQVEYAVSVDQGSPGGDVSAIAVGKQEDDGSISIVAVGCPELEAHELADLFPSLDGIEFEELKADIQRHGQHNKITLYDGKILDGRNRYRACSELGIVPRIEEYAGDDPLGYVLSLNLHRRHLNESQRAMVASKLATMGIGNPNFKSGQGHNRVNLPDSEGDDKPSELHNKEAPQVSLQQSADLLQVSRKSVQFARKVSEQGSPELIQAVESGDIAVSTAAALADLSPEEQAEVVKEPPKAIVEKAKKVTKQKKAEKRLARRAEEAPDAIPRPINHSITVYNGDARALPLEDETVHLIVTSPPYNVGTEYESYRDEKSFVAYMQLLRDTWGECKRVLVPGGRLCVNVPIGTGRSPYFPLGAHVTRQIESVLSLLGTVIWGKDTTGNRTTWGSWRSPTNPSIRDTCELIVIAQKPGEFIVPKDILVPDEETGGLVSPWLSSEQFTTYTRDYWQIKPETDVPEHPAPFPVELAERLIRLYAFPGALVVDPFAGSGTVGVAAGELGASAVLVDIDKKYCEVAKVRCGCK